MYDDPQTTQPKRKSPRRTAAELPCAVDAPAERVRASKLYVALNTVTKSKNTAVTPTLKRLANCAIRKLLRMHGKRKQR